MTIPYTNMVEIDATGGETVCTLLPGLCRGVINRLIVKQTAGTLDGFTFNIYDRLDACSMESVVVDNPDDEVELMDQELHRIQAEQTVAASAAISEQYGLELAYENQDERDAVSGRLINGFYIEIEVAGTGSKTFQVAFTETSPA